MTVQENRLSRREFFRKAAVIGVGAAALTAGSAAVARVARAATLQPNWAYCVLCHEITWATSQFVGGGRCPAQPYNGHAIGTTNYSGIYNQGAVGNPGDPNSSGYQPGWYFCNLCYGMVWHQYNGVNHCVASSGGQGAHDLGNSFDYAAPFGINGSSYQNNWNACSACGCYYWSQYGWGTDAGVCWPRTQVSGNDSPHVHASTSHYQMLFT